MPNEMAIYVIIYPAIYLSTDLINWLPKVSREWVRAIVGSPGPTSAFLGAPWGHLAWEQVWYFLNVFPPQGLEPFGKHSKASVRPEGL